MGLCHSVAPVVFDRGVQQSAWSRSSWGNCAVVTSSLQYHPSLPASGHLLTVFMFYIQPTHSWRHTLCVQKCWRWRCEWTLLSVYNSVQSKHSCVYFLNFAGLTFRAWKSVTGNSLGCWCSWTGSSHRGGPVICFTFRHCFALTIPYKTKRRLRSGFNTENGTHDEQDPSNIK